MSGTLEYCAPCRTLVHACGGQLRTRSGVTAPTGPLGPPTQAGGPARCALSRQPAIESSK